MNLKIGSIRILLFLGIFVWITLLNIFAQTVSSYPKDGQIRDLNRKVQQDIVVAKDGSGNFLFIQCWEG